MSDTLPQVRIYVDLPDSKNNTNRLESLLGILIGSTWNDYNKIQFSVVFSENKVIAVDCTGELLQHTSCKDWLLGFVTATVALLGGHVLSLPVNKDKKPVAKDIEEIGITSGKDYKIRISERVYVGTPEEICRKLERGAFFHFFASLKSYVVWAAQQTGLESSELSRMYKMETPEICAYMLSKWKELGLLEVLAEDLNGEYISRDKEE